MSVKLLALLLGLDPVQTGEHTLTGPFLVAVSLNYM